MGNDDLTNVDRNQQTTATDGNESQLNLQNQNSMNIDKLVKLHNMMARLIEENIGLKGKLNLAQNDRNRYCQSQPNLDVPAAEANNHSQFSSMFRDKLEDEEQSANQVFFPEVEVASEVESK